MTLNTTATTSSIASTLQKPQLADLYCCFALAATDCALAVLETSATSASSSSLPRYLHKQQQQQWQHNNTAPDDAGCSNRTSKFACCQGPCNSTQVALGMNCMQHTAHDAQLSSGHHAVRLARLQVAQARGICTARDRHHHVPSST